MLIALTPWAWNPWPVAQLSVKALWLLCTSITAQRNSGKADDHETEDLNTLKSLLQAPPAQINRQLIKEKQI